MTLRVAEKLPIQSTGKAHDLGVGVRACVQCGLSISETATFCQVCGARFDGGAVMTAVTETSVRFTDEPATAQSAELAADLTGRAAPGLDLADPADLASEQTEPAELTAEPAEPAAGPEPAVLAVETTDLAGPPEPAATSAAEPAEPLELDADLVTVGPATEAEPSTDAEAEPAPEADATPAAEADADAEPVAPEPEVDPAELRKAELAALLDEAAGCEGADVARAATLYGDAVVGCLEATEDPLASDDVRPMLLRSFNGLSSALERGGLPEEALAVVDDAAALGLLNGGDAAPADRQALRDRRESLRKILFADSAQL
jgi:hypothetical protein